MTPSAAAPGRGEINGPVEEASPADERSALEALRPTLRQSWAWQLVQGYLLVAVQGSIHRAAHPPGAMVVGQSAADGGWAPDPPPRRRSDAAPGAVGGGLPACFVSSLWRNSTSRCTRDGPPSRSPRHWGGTPSFAGRWLVRPPRLDPAGIRRVAPPHSGQSGASASRGSNRSKRSPQSHRYT